MIVCGKGIKVQGRLIRIASLDADTYQFLDDPQPVLEGLRKCGTRIDLFTFMQSVRRLVDPTDRMQKPEQSQASRKKRGCCPGDALRRDARERNLGSLQRVPRPAG